MKTITLKTEPISVNDLYTGRRFLTRQGKHLKNAMAWEIKSAFNRAPFRDSIAVNIIFYLKNNRKDLDNLLKAFLDCCKGILFDDDRQVVELHVFKEIDKTNPRIEISIV